MHRLDVRSTEDALAYLTSCTLSTVKELAGKKSGKSEYKRQTDMAQFSVDYLKSISHKSVCLYYKEVMEKGGSVNQWAKQFEPQ